MIRVLQLKDCHSLYKAFDAIGWNKPFEIFTEYYQDQIDGKRICFVIEYKSNIIGYTTLYFDSHYEHFMLPAIPEIYDLNILPIYQKKGYGTSLIKKCENIAKKLHFSSVGLGVGLTKDYANAINLYIKLGYTIDGNGISSNGKILNYNQTTIADDHLNIYLTKKL
ncbi:MAG: ribosomal protein S18 acetylase RimI-like enzyme [Candidatus Deianiraeaceae bacterium]|jgi:ribosomal protein S18 acetylase RimI-like enzyme